MDNFIIAIPIIIGVLMILWLINMKRYNSLKQEQNQNNSEKQGEGRKATEEESIFIDKALDDYHSSIIIVLNNGNTSSGRYRNQVLLSENDEIFVQIEILHNKKPLLANCYFSGKSDMFYNNKKASIDDFSIGNITKGLLELGFKNVGFSNIPANT